MQLSIQEAQAIINSPVLSKEFPVSVAFKLSRLSRQITEELKLVDEQRIKLIQKHNGVLSDDQSVYTFPEGMTGFAEDMEELLKTNLDFNFDPISVVTLGNMSFTPAEMASISPLLTD